MQMKMHLRQLRIFDKLFILLFNDEYQIRRNCCSFQLIDKPYLRSVYSMNVKFCLLL